MRIHNELEELQANKYKQLKANCEEELAADDKAFKMNAAELLRMQDIVSMAMGRRLASEDTGTLFEADIDSFFEAFNAKIAKVFAFTEANEFIENALRPEHEVEAEEPAADVASLASLISK